MTKTSILSHVIIMETTKPHAACIRNLGAHERKTDPGLNSPEYKQHRSRAVPLGGVLIYLLKPLERLISNILVCCNRSM